MRESLLFFCVLDKIEYAIGVFLEDTLFEHLLHDEIVLSHLLLLLGHLGFFGLQSLNFRKPSWLHIPELRQLDDGIGHFLGLVCFLALLLLDRLLGPASLCTRLHEIG